MANLVQVFDPTCAISWKPGYYPGNDVLRFCGLIWRYDLAPLGRPRPRSGSLTVGRQYLKTCTK
jgi:hypothetical protein